MSIPRLIAGVHEAVRHDIADLVTRRPLPGVGISRLGPFLFLNHHGPQIYRPGNDGLPFGPHPHRGFETVTFILAGSLAHRDSAGNENITRAGGVQWMTAGSGLVHNEIAPEEFRRHGGCLELLQLWVNLPARLKMTQPRYVGVQRDLIPIVEDDKGRVRVALISGSLFGYTGPITSLTGVFMSTVDIGPGGRVQFDGLGSRDVLLYVVRGDILIGPASVGAYSLVELSAGDTLTLESEAGAHIIFGHAQPIDEPVVAHGPFVMNSAAEIKQAYADYNAGRWSASVPAHTSTTG